MDQAAIFQPFVGLMLLTFVVWCYMYLRRLTFLYVNKIDPATLGTPISRAKVIPEDVSLAVFNFRNLLELPVLFYALCLYLYVTATVDPLHLLAAWWFLLFRMVHSVIHCTVNIVRLRFLAYLSSALALWVMLGRITADALAS